MIKLWMEEMNKPHPCAGEKNRSSKLTETQAREIKRSREPLLVLAARYDVDEAAMDRQDLDPEQPKDVAIFRIHVFGYILQLFVETAA